MNFITRANEALESLGIAPNGCLTEVAVRAVNKAARTSVWPKTAAAERAIRRLRRQGMTKLDVSSYVEALAWAVAMGQE